MTGRGVKTSNRAVVIGDDVRAILATLPPVDTDYFLYLASVAPPDGSLWDHAATTAEILGHHPVTISKSRGRLEGRGIIARTGGGYKGQAVEMTIFRSLADGWDRLKTRALAAIATRRRLRAEAAKARTRMRNAKASQTANPLISSKDEGWRKGPYSPPSSPHTSELPIALHPYSTGCCPLPPQNRVHQ